MNTTVARAYLKEGPRLRHLQLMTGMWRRLIWLAYTETNGSLSIDSYNSQIFDQVMDQLRRMSDRNPAAIKYVYRMGFTRRQDEM